MMINLVVQVAKHFVFLCKKKHSSVTVVNLNQKSFLAYDQNE